MNRLVALLAPVALVASMSAATFTHNTPQSTVVYDGFGGATLNTRLWTATAHAVIPGETSIYTASQVTVDDGMLKLTAEDIDGQWESGEVTSTWALRYGVFSWRARIEGFSEGAWPGIYLEGIGSWPSCGEIDGLESMVRLDRGHQEENVMTVHGSDTGNPTSHWFVPQFTPINYAKWNTFAIIKTPNAVYFRVDGKAVAQFRRTQLTGTEQWPFDDHQYNAMMDLAIGAWAGQPNNTTAKKITLDIDWYRVQKL